MEKNGFRPNINPTECRLWYFVHRRASFSLHVAHANLIKFQVVTKFCAHLHDVQEGGFTCLKNS